EMLELPREPKPFEGKKLELKVLRRMMEELVERRALLKQLAPHLETIIAVQHFLVRFGQSTKLFLILDETALFFLKLCEADFCTGLRGPRLSVGLVLCVLLQLLLSGLEAFLERSRVLNLHRLPARHALALCELLCMFELMLIDPNQGFQISFFLFRLIR
ncbi:hypothetical protein, partial [Enterococcus faecalis]|uniref:hypothetical protein n=1 Tax=Enterococcus faecalis TaxID=1351 RepID=UPI0025B09C52